jgi:hypothetical protein
MMRRSLRIATTPQWERSVREAGFETLRLPDLPSLDFHRSLGQRLQDGPVYRAFLEQNDIELVLDFNTEALTLTRAAEQPDDVELTTAALGIPYVACYLDPITSTMGQVRWADHWQVLESRGWIKWIWETAHAEELTKLSIPNVLTLPMGAASDDFDRTPLPEPDPGPAVAFMGHPASSWFRSDQPIQPSQLFAGLTAAAVRADMPDLPFHKIYFDLHQLGVLPASDDDAVARAEKAGQYYQDKFVYNAYLALKQRDRFARFLKGKLGDLFELVGDHWGTNYGLAHTARIWDPKVLHERMRRVPICLNLMKGNLETGLNIRHFEITAYGGFMLTYWTDELPGCFQIGRECDVFRNEAELLEKIAYYLDHAAQRREIALRGQQRTLSEHLYSHRVLRLVEMLRQSGILPRTDVRRAPASTEPCALVS